MKGSAFCLVIGLLTLIAFVASACSGTAPDLAPPTVTPIQAVATPMPPTATPVRAASTSTPVLPTVGPVPATSTSGGGASTGSIFSAALEKAKDATSYRVDMQTTGKGAFGSGGPETPAPNVTPLPPANQELTMISMHGEVNGTNSHFRLQGLFAAFLGVDPTKSLEVITVGDKSYIHGPVALLGASEDKWYELPADESSVAKPPLTPGSFLESFTLSGVNASEFKKTGTESLDDRSCDVYSGDKSLIEKAFKDVGQATGGQDLSSIDSAEFKFWICDDGYLHQIRMAVEGHETDKPDQKNSFVVQMHLFDLGADIKIEAPSNAEPLKMPSFINPGTPTP
jgi:hypothetical protein